LHAMQALSQLSYTPDRDRNNIGDYVLCKYLCQSECSRPMKNFDLLRGT